MLAAFDAEQGFAAAGERVGECAVKFGKVRVGRAAIGAAVSCHEAYRAGPEPPAHDVEIGLNLSDQPVFCRSRKQGRNHLEVGLPIEPLAPDVDAPEPAGEQAARAATHDERLPAYAGVATPRRINNERGCDPRTFLLGYGPWFAQVLARSARDRLDVALIERVAGDREALAEVIEQIDEGLAARGRARGTKFSRGVRECAVVRGELIDRNIIGPHQPQLFQVRIGEPPAAALVNPSAVSQDAGKGAFGIVQPNAYDVRVEHPLLSSAAFRRLEFQHRLQADSKLIFGESIRTGRPHRRERCGAQQRHK